MKDGKSTEELLGWLGIDCVSEVVTRCRLRWFGHVERKSDFDCVKTCRDLQVEGVKGRGRARKTWNECVEEDMRSHGLRREMAQDRAVWESGVLGRRLPRASAEKRTLKR